MPDARLVVRRRLLKSARSLPQRRVRVEGNYSCRRLGDAIASGDPSGIEAVVAGVRQADDLLSVVGAAVGGDSRDPGDLDAGGYATLQAVAGRWRTVGAQAAICRAAVARWISAGVSDR